MHHPPVGSICYRALNHVAAIDYDGRQRVQCPHCLDVDPHQQTVT